jgi:hypothetical protein
MNPVVSLVRSRHHQMAIPARVECARGGPMLPDELPNSWIDQAPYRFVVLQHDLNSSFETVALASPAVCLVFAYRTLVTASGASRFPLGTLLRSWPSCPARSMVDLLRHHLGVAITYSEDPPRRRPIGLLGESGSGGVSGVSDPHPALARGRKPGR